MKTVSNFTPNTIAALKEAQPLTGFAHIPVLSNTTSVSLKPELYREALRLAGGDATRVVAALREAALEIALSDSKKPAPAISSNVKVQTFSARVRAKALAKLRGAFRHGVVINASKEQVSPAADAVAVALAIENNKAWDKV